MKEDILHLDSNEHVLMEVRKHWIVFLNNAIGLLFSAFLPFIFVTILSYFSPGFFDHFSIDINISALITFLYTIWILFLWVMFFVDWTKYYLDVWYITEKRIISIDQKDIFNRKVFDMRVDRIQDITINVNGFVATAFNFGDIRIQTMGEDNSILFLERVNKPEVVKRVILNHKNSSSESTQRIF